MSTVAPGRCPQSSPRTAIWKLPFMKPRMVSRSAPLHTENLHMLGDGVIPALAPTVPPSTEAQQRSPLDGTPVVLKAVPGLQNRGAPNYTCTMVVMWVKACCALF